MGFFGNKNRRKYDPEIISNCSRYVLGKHDSDVVAQNEVNKLRDQASIYAKEKYGVEIPSTAFIRLIKMTDFKDSALRSQIVEHCKDDKSIERTARYFKTSVQTVSKILKEYGLSISTGLRSSEC